MDEPKTRRHLAGMNHPMKLVVLGASGGVGRHLVTQGRDRGHQVVAVARESSRLELPEGVSERRGSIFDPDFLQSTFAGADAVLSAIGLRLPGLSPFAKAEIPGLLTRSTPVIVRACEAAQVSRLVAVSAGGVGDSRAWMPGFFKLFIALTAMRHAYRELEEMERCYAASGLEVCCPRPTGLTDEPATGEVVVATRLVGRASIPRADVAAWMLDAVARESLGDFGPVLTVTGAG